ncbi:hypothetical protein BEST7613_3009 [Bacillus subtilis BEST7613]|nr:hypothetical protein BEST7613_3009 [Bacillus subtilis BEST7613]
MTKQEKTALNMARFIRSQTLTLLEKLNELDADEQADICESLHDHADELYRRGSLGCRSKFELGTLAAASGRLCGVEALIRWQHPIHGLVSPGLFIGLLETTGLIIPVGEWIMRTAFQHFHHWAPAVDDDFRIAINLSPQQFQAPDLLPTILRILAESSLPPHRLEVEITENIVMQNVTATQNLLNALQSHGIRLSMDDFGTGYSSLSYLKTFPFNTLKIDRSFTKDILHTPKDAAIIQAMLLLGNGFNLNIIAEGIEEEPQARCLYDLGCREMQGYWFSHPLSEAEITAFLAEGNFQRFCLG